MASSAAQTLAPTVDLSVHGISRVREVVYNPSYEQLFEEETKSGLQGFERCTVTDLGAVAVDTGEFTGRSPKDKYIVRDDTTRDTLWWNDQGKNDNKPISTEVWNDLKQTVLEQLTDKRLFVVDTYCGTNANTRLAVRFITEVAWQAHFVKNMFVRPSEAELATYEPDFVVMNGARTTNSRWQEHGMSSENFIAFNLTERMQLIGGTWYGGEMKKGMFSIMNYLLPQRGIASMHCSANVGHDGDVAVFCLKMSWCAMMAVSILTIRQKPKMHVCRIRFITSTILSSQCHEPVMPIGSFSCRPTPLAYCHPFRA